MKLPVDRIDISIAIDDDSMIALCRKRDENEPFIAEQFPIGNIPQECAAMIHYLESR